MKLSFSTLGCHDYNLDQIIACAVKYGFDGVELRHVDKNVKLWETKDLNTAALPAAKKKFNDSGIDVPVIGASTSFAKPGEESGRAQLDDLKRWAEIAQALDCPYIRVFGGPVPEGQSMEDTVKYDIEGYNEAIPQIARYNVTILFETHDSFSTSKNLLPVLKGLEGSFGVVWDILHPYRFGESVEDTFSNLRPYIKHLHLKDSKVFSDKGADFMLMGEGKVPAPQIIDLMKNSGYSGYYSFEWERGWHPEIPHCDIAFPHYVNYMKQFA